MDIEVNALRYRATPQRVADAEIDSIDERRKKKIATNFCLRAAIWSVRLNCPRKRAFRHVFAHTVFKLIINYIKLIRKRKKKKTQDNALKFYSMTQ